MATLAQISLIFDDAYPLTGSSSPIVPVPIAISGGGAAPTQFEVWLSDGTWAYVRYRGGILTVDFGTVDWIAGADGKSFVEYEPFFAGDGSDRIRLRQCSWREAEPFLIHALVLSAGRRLSSDGYVTIEPSRL